MNSSRNESACKQTITTTTPSSSTSKITINGCCIPRVTALTTTTTTVDDSLLNEMNGAESNNELLANQSTQASSSRQSSSLGYNSVTTTTTTNTSATASRTFGANENFELIQPISASFTDIIAGQPDKNDCEAVDLELDDDGDHQVTAESKLLDVTYSKGAANLEDPIQALNENFHSQQLLCNSSI